MHAIRVRFAYLPLLLLWLWLDRCESLTDSSLPDIFYPFGSDEGDSIVTPGDSCSEPINMTYEIFNYTSLYVSSTHVKPERDRVIALNTSYLSTYIITRRALGSAQTSANATHSPQDLQ